MWRGAHIVQGPFNNLHPQGLLSIHPKGLGGPGRQLHWEVCHHRPLKVYSFARQQLEGRIHYAFDRFGLLLLSLRGESQIILAKLHPDYSIIVLVQRKSPINKGRVTNDQRVGRAFKFPKHGGQCNGTWSLHLVSRHFHRAELEIHERIDWLCQDPL